MTETKDKKNIWDLLAENDPKLTTDGFHILEGNYSAEDVGSMAVARRYIETVQGGRLLDIGCGWGKIVSPFAAAGMKVSGMDISSVMLKNAREYVGSNGERAGFVNADAEFMPFRGRVFDVIWSYAVLIHLPKNKVDGILNEASRVMTPDGHAYLHFKNSVHILSLAMLLLRAYVGLSGKKPLEVAIRRYTMPEIKRMAGKYFGSVEIMAENMELLPLSIPNNFFSSGDKVIGGIVTDRDTRFVNLLPKFAARRVMRFYDWLKDKANSGFGFLKPFSKDFIVILSKPKA